MRRLRAQRRRDLGRVVEGEHRLADDLALLVAFARDDQHVAVAQQADGRADRLAPIADLARAGCGREDFTANRSRFLCTRIVVSDDDDIGGHFCDGAHQGALRTIAIAAGAEGHDQPPTRVRTKCFEHGFQTIWGVGIIDEGYAAPRACADTLHSAGRALQMLERRQHSSRVFARGDAQAGGDERVRRLEGPDER